MDELKAQFKDFVIPTAPSLLYEKQYLRQTSRKKLPVGYNSLHSLYINIVRKVSFQTPSLSVTEYV